ncbi:MAG: hypothetical protein ABI867_13760, partial [Kofleriaceae bacterium]
MPPSWRCCARPRSFGCGAIPYSAARELTRVASPRTERAWLDHVAGKNLREIEEAVQGRKYDDDPTAPTDPRLRRQRLAFVDILPETLALMRQARQ